MKKPKHLRSHKQNKTWLIVLAAVVLLFSTIYFSFRPSNNREWENDFALIPSVELQNDFVTIKNIRDWRHTPEKTISHNYIERTYLVSDLEKVWFLIEPFGKWDGVAHTYFVFDFKNQPPIAFSIEARREKGEEYSAFMGLFKKYELIYMWGTEEDFTLKRVIQQKNKVHMYPLTVSTEFQKKLFVELARATHKLETEPRFYNTVTSNCTNNLAYHANSIKPNAAPFHYARFLTGYSGEYVYNLGYIPTDKSYTEIQSQYLINPIVEEIYQAENFSQLLREKLLP